MQLRSFIAAVGGVLVLVALVLGFSDVVSRQGVSCGSPFVTNLSEAEHREAVDELTGTLVGGRSTGTDFVGQCEDALGARPMLAWLVLGGGIILLAGGLVVRTTAELNKGDQFPPTKPPTNTMYG